MALNGTLADLGVIDLIQFPHAGRKTGELIIVGTEHEARLYYEKGNLVHARMEDVEGHDVLVEVVAWTQGEFEFRLDVEAERKSIEMDLHRSLMHALKTRDEREERRRQQGSDDVRRADRKTIDPLRRFVDSTEWATHASLVGKDGEILGEVNAEGRQPEQYENLRNCLLSLLMTYPRDGFGRLFIEDDEGTIVLSRIDADLHLLIVATADAPMGAVSVGVGKFAASLHEKGDG
jgi:predicted regulator of Ras-like GTPase activity (Roadblock/LC7/MglB family)